jgi:fusion and transport protein UGO1
VEDRRVAKSMERFATEKLSLSSDVLMNLTGILTSCVNEALSSTLQPLILNALRPFNPSGSLLAPVVSHMATGFILSPLDLLRTRQIVHPRATRPSALTHLGQIIREEGGLKAVYLDARFLFPTLLDHSVRPLIALALPGLIQRHLGLRDPASNPLTFPLAEFTGACAGLLVTLPIETVRRRLQVQSSRATGSGSGKVEACVRVRPWPYVGVVDALWRILSEERSAPPRRRRRTRGKGRLRETEFIPEVEEGFLTSTGVGQLFRGFGMGVGALALVLVIALATGGEDEGWAEL